MLVDTKQEKQIVFTSREFSELRDVDLPENSLKPNEIAGRTLYTLTSPGTEINGGYLGDSFPKNPGYTAVFEVEQVGEEVFDVVVGERMFCKGPHRSFQRAIRETALKIPKGLSSIDALFARLAGVSMTTLVTTTARPGDKVAVFGLGPVGILAAQVFQACGYSVYCVEPMESRRQLAANIGLKAVFPSSPLDNSRYVDQTALVLECSGHEQAVLDACKIVRKRGEVVLIGVPWKRRMDMQAFELTHEIFHRYVVLRSGWEWELPQQESNFNPHSTTKNYKHAFDLLLDGKIKVGGLYSIHRPDDAQEVYQKLLHNPGNVMSVVFDWRK